MKRSALAVMMVFLICTIAEAQDVSTVRYVPIVKSYHYFSISPVGGAIFPVSKDLTGSFKPGGSAGLDLGYRVNREVGFYGKLGYYAMSSKITGQNIGSYFVASVGPRYYFTSPHLKSTFFLEGGVGAYYFRQRSSAQIVSPSTFSTIDDISRTKAGLSGGMGGSIALSNYLDILVKSDYHVIFTPVGTSSFISVMGGLQFNIY